jgi:hypothetical protein
MAAEDLPVLGRIVAALSGSYTCCGIGLVAPNDYLDALRALSGLLFHLDRCAHPLDQRPARPVVAAPEPASTRRDLLVRADRLLCPNPDRAVAQLRASLEQVPRSYGRPAWVRDHSTPTSVSEPILRRALSEAVSVGWAQIDPVPHFDPATVPQLLWPDVWAELRGSTRCGPLAGRAFISLLLVKMNLAVTWLQAGEVLEWPTDLTRRVSRTGQQHLTESEGFARRLQEASQSHLGAPDTVNYRNRERLVRRLSNSSTTVLEWQQRNHLTVETSLVVTHAWSTWAMGHRSLAPRHHLADPTWRKALSCLNYRWKPLYTAELHDWLTSLDDPQVPVGPTNDQREKSADRN